MLCVARSRRMCCSRVWRARTKPRRPSTSTASPAIRPGIRRICSSVAQKNPNEGPPKSSRPPSGCPSPIATSAPHSPGGRRTPSVIGSTGDDRQPARLSCGAPSAPRGPRPRRGSWGSERIPRRSRRRAPPRARPDRSSRHRDRPRRPRPRIRASTSPAPRGRAGGRRARRRTAAARWRRSPGTRPRRASRVPRTARSRRPEGLSARRSRSGTRTPPAGGPGTPPAGRACTGSGTRDRWVIASTIAGT